MRKRAFYLAGACLAVSLIAACAVRQPAPAAQAEPVVVSVAQWGGTPADESRARRHAITHITLHHGGVAFARGRDPRQYLRDLQSWSRATKGWIDLPYHYAIDLDGKIYEGRRLDFAGDTNTEYDPAGHALIEVIGNYEEIEPNERQLEAIVNLMAALAREYRVPVERIRGHRDWSAQTVCPGRHLYRYLQEGYFQREVQKRLDASRAG